MNVQAFYNVMKQGDLAPWVEQGLPDVVDAYFKSPRWGDIPKWQAALNELPDIQPSSFDLNSSAIRIGEANDINDAVQLEETLRTLHPWRKGPFDVFGIPIETEWRSDLKWDRLKGHMASLKDKTVLDIGCGSGYHCWRMAGQGAKLVMGIDPTMLYVFQFWAMQKYVQQEHVAVLPLGIDDCPEDLPVFDTVFSMGLLYHRRSPLDHLLQLGNLLKEGGELVLETLVIDGQQGDTLTPKDRYAMMPNVWFIPSCATLETWLAKMKFQNIRCVDVTQTSIDEQRPTDWMGFQSLEHFLDPNDPNKTIEGYPAPKRAIFLANK